MTHKQYDALDELILTRIGEGFTTFHQIDARAVRDEADRIAHITGEPDSWRITDRRLQALRKKGVISYSRKPGWVLVEPKEPTHA